MRFQPDVMRRYADAVAMERELAELVGRDVELVDYRSVVDWSDNHIRRAACPGVGSDGLCRVKSRSTCKTFSRRRLQGARTRT